jgi:hypothetical protein
MIVGTCVSLSRGVTNANACLADRLGSIFPALSGTRPLASVLMLEGVGIFSTRRHIMVSLDRWQLGARPSIRRILLAKDERVGFHLAA